MSNPRTADVKGDDTNGRSLKTRRTLRALAALGVILGTCAAVVLPAAVDVASGYNHGAGAPELGVLMSARTREMAQLLGNRWRLLPTHANGAG